MAKKEIDMAKPKKQHSFTFVAVLFAVISLAVVVLLNLMVSRINKVWDLTPTGIYELTDSTKKRLSTIDKKVNIYFLYDMDVLSTDPDSLPLYNALVEYGTYDCINFEAFDPEDNVEKTNELKNMGYSLSQGDLVIECEGRSKHIPAYTMFETHTEKTSDGNAKVSSIYFTGENLITGAIEAVVTGREVKVYFLTGHGEKQLDTSFTTLKKNLSARNYLSETLDLTSKEAVPEDAVIVIVAAPKTDITAKELEVLNNYLDNGGNICFWMEPNEDALDYTNIESILKDFGIAMDYDKVYETDPDLYVPGDQSSFRCSIVRADDTQNIDLTSELQTVLDNGAIPVMTNSRSFMQIMDGTIDTNKILVGSLLQTVDRVGDGSSTAVGEPFGGEKPRDRVENVVLDLAMYSNDISRKNSKIIVMGNSEFFDDDNINQAYSVVPVNLQLAAFSWMHDSDQDLDFGIAGKKRSFDEMSIEAQTSAIKINVLFIGIPVLVGIIGGIVWLRRRYSE